MLKTSFDFEHTKIQYSTLLSFVGRSLCFSLYLKDTSGGRTSLGTELVASNIKANGLYDMRWRSSESLYPGKYDIHVTFIFTLTSGEFYVENYHIHMYVIV